MGPAPPSAASRPAEAAPAASPGRRRHLLGEALRPAGLGQPGPLARPASRPVLDGAAAWEESRLVTTEGSVWTGLAIESHPGLISALFPRGPSTWRCEPCPVPGCPPHRAASINSRCCRVLVPFACWLGGGRPGSAWLGVGAGGTGCWGTWGTLPFHLGKRRPPTSGSSGRLPTLGSRSVCGSRLGWRGLLWRWDM